MADDKQSGSLIFQEQEVSGDAMQGMNDLAAKIADMDIRIESIKQELEECEKFRSNLSDELMKLMQSYGLDEFKGSSGRVKIESRWAASISEANSEVAFPWLRSLGLGSHIKTRESIHHTTLSAEVKRLVESGDVSLDTLKSKGVGLVIKEKVKVSK